MNKEPFVFISYSTKNQEYAEAIRRILIDENIRCWMAPYDIPPGSRYAEVINDAIKDSSCMLLMLTDAAQKSKFVYNEVGRAFANGKSIIPIQLEKLELTSGFEYYIGEDQIVQVETIDKNNPEIQRIIESIKSFMSTESNPLPKKPLENLPEEEEISFPSAEEFEFAEEDELWEDEWERNTCASENVVSRLKRIIEYDDDDDYSDARYFPGEEEDEPKKEKVKVRGTVPCGILLLLFALFTLFIRRNHIRLWVVVSNFEEFGFKSEALFSKVLKIFTTIHIGFWIAAIILMVYYYIIKQKKLLRAAVMIIIMAVMTVINVRTVDISVSREKCTNSITIGYCNEKTYYEILQGDGSINEHITIDRTNALDFAQGEFYHGDYLVLTCKLSEEWEKMTKNMNLPEDAYAIYLPVENLRYYDLKNINTFSKRGS